MMRTQNQAEHAVIHSSIALLQERFKQLQRVKEMREKKELLRLFSDHYKLNAPTPPPPTTTTTASNSYNHEHLATHNNNNNNNTSTTTINHNNVVDVHDDDNDELQIFLPPNYYHTNYNRPKPNSSLSLSHNSNNINNSHNNYHHNTLHEISLSLWPPAVSHTNATTTTVADRCRRGIGSLDTPLSTLSRSASSCLSSAFKFEDSQHVTADVDTTLHL